MEMRTWKQKRSRSFCLISADILTSSSQTKAAWFMEKKSFFNSYADVSGQHRHAMIISFSIQLEEKGLFPEDPPQKDLLQTIVRSIRACKPPFGVAGDYRYNGSTDRCLIVPLWLAEIVRKTLAPHRFPAASGAIREFSVDWLQTVIRARNPE